MNIPGRPRIEVETEIKITIRAPEVIGIRVEILLLLMKTCLLSLFLPIKRRLQQICILASYLTR